MATDQGSNRRAGWDQLPSPDAGSTLAARRHAREAEAAQRARRWYHARWIALNVALIALLAWLYLNFLIPRYIDQPENQYSAGRVAPSTEPNDTAAFITAVTANLDQERHRLRRKPMLTPAQQSEADAFQRAMREGRGSCINGVPFQRVDRAGVTHIEQIGRDLSLTCHVPATPNRD